MTPRTRRRVFLREAMLSLLLARLAVRVLPSAFIFNWADRPMKRLCRFTGDDADWIAWAIEHAATLPGMRAPCLPQALAAHAMLRRRSITSRLCLGVAREGGNVTAHAWVESGGRRVIGGAEAGSFTRLATFGHAT